MTPFTSPNNPQFEGGQGNWRTVVRAATRARRKLVRERHRAEARATLLELHAAVARANWTIEHASQSAANFAAAVAATRVARPRANRWLTRLRRLLGGRSR